MSKNTVKSYLKKMADGGFNTEELLKQEDPLLEKSFHAENPAYKADNIVIEPDESLKVKFWNPYPVWINYLKRLKILI